MVKIAKPGGVPGTGPMCAWTVMMWDDDSAMCKPLPGHGLFQTQWCFCDIFLTGANSNLSKLNIIISIPVTALKLAILKITHPHKH